MEFTKYIFKHNFFITAKKVIKFKFLIFLEMGSKFEKKVINYENFVKDVENLYLDDHGTGITGASQLAKPFCVTLVGYMFLKYVSPYVQKSKKKNFTMKWPRLNKAIPLIAAPLVFFPMYFYNFHTDLKSLGYTKELQSEYRVNF